MVKTKILLVEDDKSLREIYGVRLYSEGYDIISAGDGEEALAMAIKDRPSLIISDVMMPKISGFDMLDILRSTTETKDIRVIMMTALSSEDQRARGEALGADRYLVKSQVGIEDVVRAVHEVLADAPVTSVAGPAAGPAPMPAPTAAPPMPAMAPAPQPAAPVAPPISTPAASPLPQPTAPFSTNRPATLGDRVIHPLETSEPSKDFGAMMSAELNGGITPPPAPVADPSAPSSTVAPAPAAQIPGATTSLDDELLIPPIPATSAESTGDTNPVPAPPTPQPVAAPSVSTLPPATPAPAVPLPSGLTFEETPHTPVVGVAPSAAQPAEPIAPPAIAPPVPPMQPPQAPPAPVAPNPASTLPPTPPAGV